MNRDPESVDDTDAKTPPDADDVVDAPAEDADESAAEDAPAEDAEESTPPDEDDEAEPVEDEPVEDKADEPVEDEPADDEPADVGEPADVEAPPGAAVPVDPADAARRRLRRALVPRTTRSQLLAAAVCAVLGFAVVVQARQTEVASLSSLRQSDLVTLLDNVTQESARLDDQATSLQGTLAQLRSTTDRAPAARQAAQSRADTLGVLAGTLPATGPGLELDILDPNVAINATEMLDAIQELRGAGAEAVQVGTVRVVARTAFVDDPTGLIVDGTLLTPPYRVLAIGDPQTMSAALEIPGGVVEVLRGRQAQVTVHTEQVVRVTALLQARTPEYARPAAIPSP
jgi:uncharacterized protein YlxW (UPF0749 family)